MMHSSNPGLSSITGGATQRNTVENDLCGCVWRIIWKAGAWPSAVYVQACDSVLRFLDFVEHDGNLCDVDLGLQNDNMAIFSV